MMLVVNYAKKIKAELPLLTRPDPATAQRSAAAQQTAGGAARVDLCVPVRCSASARAATAMALPSLLVVQQRVERGCAPPPAFPIQKQPAAQ